VRAGALALIAHDGRKEAMIALAEEWRELLGQLDLVGTATTGTLVQNHTALPVRRMLSGPLGGDLQIGALVATGEIAAVIFLRDPLTAHPHDPDISALMKVCDTHNVPLATNVATAQILLRDIARDPVPER